MIGQEKRDQAGRERSRDLVVVRSGFGSGVGDNPSIKSGLVVHSGANGGHE
jgi:hypothetical protein